jgi:hypothetical protein
MRLLLLALAAAASPGIAQTFGLPGESTETLPDMSGEQVINGGIELDDCRVPVENPTGDAFAHLVIRAEGMQDAAFDGWMIASSPALSALDHPRYDVWVIRCRMS